MIRYIKPENVLNRMDLTQPLPVIGAREILLTESALGIRKDVKER